MFRNSFLALTMGTATAAHAAHPLITEDTGTQGKGGWQLELDVERQHDSGTRATQWGSTLSYDSSAGTTLRQYVLGFIYSVTKDFDLDAGVRRGNTPAVDRALMAGVTVRW